MKMFLNEESVRISIEEVKKLVEDSVAKVFHRLETSRRNYQKVEIRTCEDSPVFTQIFIGGQKIDGIRNWSLTQKSGDIPRLHLDINAMNLDVDGRCVCFAEGWGDFAMRMIPPDSDEMNKEGE